MCFWTLYTSLPNSLQECMLPRKVRHNCHHGRHECIMCVGGSADCSADMTWQTRVMTCKCAVHDPHLVDIASPMPPSHDGRSCGTTDVSSAYAACIDHQHRITPKIKVKNTGTRLTESPTKQRAAFAPLLAPPQMSHATSSFRIETYG